MFFSRKRSPSCRTSRKTRHLNTMQTKILMPLPGSSICPCSYCGNKLLTHTHPRRGVFIAAERGVERGVFLVACWGPEGGRWRMERTLVFINSESVHPDSSMITSTSQCLQRTVFYRAASCSLSLITITEMLINLSIDGLNTHITFQNVFNSPIVQF